jgi:hypothetical protein
MMSTAGLRWLPHYLYLLLQFDHSHGLLMKRSFGLLEGAPRTVGLGPETLCLLAARLFSDLDEIANDGWFA